MGLLDWNVQCTLYTSSSQMMNSTLEMTRYNISSGHPPPAQLSRRNTTTSLTRETASAVKRKNFSLNIEFDTIIPSASGFPLQRHIKPLFERLQRKEKWRKRSDIRGTGSCAVAALAARGRRASLPRFKWLNGVLATHRCFDQPPPLRTLTTS